MAARGEQVSRETNVLEESRNPIRAAVGAEGPLRGCETVMLGHKLRTAGLRLTRQRLALASVIFLRGHRHLTAEALHAEAREAGLSMSLATVYNALNRFTEAGLLRAFGIEGQATHYDTNTHDHHHFVTERGQVLDIPADGVRILDLPEPPEGMEIAQVDVVVRLRPKE